MNVYRWQRDRLTTTDACKTHWTYEALSTENRFTDLAYLSDILCRVFRTIRFDCWLYNTKSLMTKSTTDVCCWRLVQLPALLSCYPLPSLQPPLCISVIVGHLSQLKHGSATQLHVYLLSDVSLCSFSFLNTECHCSLKKAYIQYHN